MLRCLFSAAGIFDWKQEKVGWCAERRNHAKSGRYTLPHFWVTVLFQLFLLTLCRNAPIWSQNTMGKMQGFYISRMRILEILNIWQMYNNLDSEVNDYRPVKFLNFCCVGHVRHIVLLSARFTASPWWIRISSSLSPVLKRTWNFGVHSLSSNRWGHCDPYIPKRWGWHWAKARIQFSIGGRHRAVSQATLVPS